MLVMVVEVVEEFGWGCVCVRVELGGAMLGWISPLHSIFEVLPMERIAPRCP